MPSKLHFYQAVSEQAAKEITNNRGNWTDFLDTAAKMYKYSFPDQLLIHAQRPDATACATAEMWTETFDRWNRRGSKGIALIDDTGSYPVLKYVFDVSDTYPLTKNARPVQLWEMRQEHREPVLDYLAGVYEDVDGTLADSFRNIAKQLAQEYYVDNAREIRFCAEESFIGELDDLNLGAAFENALTNSIAYTLMSRCGFDTADYFEDEDFQYIFDFNTPDMVYALGTAANELSAQVLRDIELVIKKYERQKAAERSAEHEHSNDIHAGRGLSSAGHQTERTAEGADRTSRTVRENEESISQRPPDDNVQFNASERNAVPAFEGNGGNGENEAGTSDEVIDGGEPVTRQDERPDGLDGGNERPESTSGGNGLESTDLRLNETPETPSQRIISEQGGVFQVNETLSQVGIRLAEAISASSVTVDEIDSILRDGGNDKNSVLRIAAHFAKGLTPEENAGFLRFEYLRGQWGHNETPGGKGYQFGTQQTALWFDETGISIGRGKSAIYASDRTHITWEQAAERIKALYDGGQYVSHDVLDEALYNESVELADDVIEVYGNIQRGLSDIQYELKKAMTKEQKEAVKDDWRIQRYLINGLTELERTADAVLNGENKASTDEIMRLYNETLRISEEIPPEWGFNNGHPDIVKQVTELLRDKGKLGENEISQGIGYNELSEFALILTRLKEDIAALNDEPDAPIRFWRNPYRLLSNLEKAGLPPKGFPVADYQSVNFMRFITNDEVDAYLTRGSSFSESKYRILSHFLQEHTPNERQEFLKNEYGHGGSGTWVGDGWHKSEPGKGITLSRGNISKPYAEVSLNWNQAARRTQELIRSGRYMSSSELDRIPDYERIILARRINNFYYNLPEEEYPRPFPKELDFHYPKENERAALNDFLNDTERIDSVLAQMQYIFKNTPEEDRYYNTRSEGFHSLSAYLEGTYTLFPGIENLSDPEHAVILPTSETQESNTAQTVSNPSDANEQLSLFDFENFPVLPSAEEQKARIEQKLELTAEANAPAVFSPITQDEIDALLLTVSDEEKARIAVQFADNPRSKEAVRLVREIYGGIEETIPRLNDANGDLRIQSESTGVSIVSVLPFSNPDTEIESAETITLPWAAVIKRLSELAENGQLEIAEHKPAVEIVTEADSNILDNYLDNGEIQINEPDTMQMVDDSTESDPPPEWNEYYMYSPEQRAAFSHEYSEWLERNTPSAEHFVVYEIPNRARVYAVWDNENKRFYEDESGNISTFTDKTEADSYRDTLYTINGKATETGTEPPYNIGDRIEYTGKPHEIDRIGDFIRLHNLDTSAVHPIFDYVSVPKQNFDRMLADGEISITPIQDIPAEPVMLDFDTAAQIIFERVMQNKEFAKFLENALNRGSLRNPINEAFDWIFIEEAEKGDPQNLRPYFADDDLNDKLFSFVYQKAWESRQQREAETVSQAEQTAKPSAERLSSQDGTDFYLFHFPESNENPAALSVETLSLITEKADKYIICTDLCYLSEEEMTGWGVEFRKMPRDFGMLPETVQENIAEVRPDLAEAGLKTQIYDELFGRGYTVSDELIADGIADHRGRGGKDNFKDIADYIEAAALTKETEQARKFDETSPLASEQAGVQNDSNAPVTETAQVPQKLLMITPPPVFFVNWDDAQFDFDLNFYDEHDIVGYDPDGVEYAIGRSGSLTYVTSTGAFWGSNEVPGNIYEQIAAYKNGEVSDGQVRENYISVLESFKNYRAADLEKTNAELIEVLENGIIAASEKNTIFSLLENGISNADLADMLSTAYTSETSAALTLKNGEEADFKAASRGVEIIVPEKLHKITAWTDIAPVVRSLTQKWAVERYIANEHKPSGQETPPQQQAVPSPEQEKSDVWYRVGDTVYFDNSEHEIIEIADDGVVTTRDADGELRYDSSEMFDALTFTDDRSRQLRRSRLKPDTETEIFGTETPAAQGKVMRVPSANFHITDDHLGEGSAKTKFRNNIDAINTLHRIELENRSATPEEQEILSRYVGWGGLSQTFDPKNTQWTNEYTQLKSALSAEEFESAQKSTLNAHYTSPTIIKAIYETVERMGFKTGNILEPACGVGNFFGLLPDSMRQSKLYGVELDSVTARIAKQLYPKANIKETGYEKTDTPDAFFDLAIGNVPFGGYGVIDKRYEKHKFLIHDYFFAKTLDQVRPGGVVAFVTSKGTLDKRNPEVRKYIAQRAELLGAVRMPNTAFLKNAGTEVTSDIIFLKKRDRPMDIQPDWVHLGLTEDGIPVNRYFADNPEMILGKMAFDDRMYGDQKETTCNPIEGADLAEQLKTALFNVQGQYTDAELDDIEGIDNHAIPADPNVKNFSYTEVADTVYFRENSLMYPVELPATTLERIKGMIHLRDCVHELIALQLEDYGEDKIKSKQAELSIMYDRFTAAYGLINSQGNNRAFSADNAYYLLCSLEILDEESNLARKADMFTKRTIKQKTIITHVDTASEALAVSLGERACIDMDFMSELTGFTSEKIIKDLDGVIFFDFGNPNRSLPNFDPEQMKLYEKFPLVTADEYLSGNVREKLAKAIRFNNFVGDEFHGADTTVNIKALEAAQPKDLDASEISVRLGSTWIDPEYVQQFMYELLNTAWRNKETYQVKYHKITGEWQVTGKNKAQYSDIHASVTYGTHRMNAYQIIDDTLNLRDVRVYDYKTDADGKEKRELNKKETTLAQQKQEQIKQAFKDWIWKDPTRRQTLVKEYNEKFNSVRPREYDGSHITFSGISPEITMRPHQLNAIAHNLYGGNTLLAHVVGAGKTFEMVGMAMESKRLGLCNKSLLAVPNHLTEQWAGEFLRLYPAANIIVATKKDFEMRNRKKFCAKIATGDYDAVIIGHSQLEKIPMSRERQERLLNEQLWEIEEGIRELKDSKGERYSIKQLEKTKRNLETRLAKLIDGKKRDDVVTFEQLGADRLFVDEAHGFKNLFLYTKMRNVAGLSTSEAQKSSDLFMKCRYMDELTNGKGIIFATGTPISNSMTEMYTMQRYLQYDTLTAKGLTHFDSWASIFGETQTSIELAPEGTGYRARTRFAKFHNLPELMSMFKEVADIQTADMLKLPVPEAKFENIIVEPSDWQKEMVQDLSKRAAAVHARLVEPHVDNMLKITTDGRKIGLDQRLMNPLLPDFEKSKVNACAENVFRIWNETKDARLTQLVFSDFSTPNKDGRFNIYDDIKEKLTANGIPEHEIAFIHDADTETKKKELFAKVRQGRVRVLLGSTFKMGAGTNVQDKLIATHDVDCPWRPADLEQRAGRIIRQGNNNPEVQIFRYATNGTFDSYLWQTVENKQKFIAQIMSSKSPVRSCEDVDETALSYAEIKALCAGNPLIAEKMNLDVEVAKLRMLKADHQSQHYRLEDDLLKRYPEQITSVTERIEGIEKDIANYTEHNEKAMQLQEGVNGSISATAVFASMTINGEVYAEKEPAAKALLEVCKGVTDKNDKAVGEYMGFKMSLRFDSFNRQFHLLLRGNMTYQTDLGTDAFGNITRINNLLNDLPRRLEGAKSQLDNLLLQQEAAKQELEKPFTLTNELAEKEARLALLNADLNIDGSGGLDVTNDSDRRTENADEIEPDDDEDYEEEYEESYVSQAAYAKSARPPMLETIRSFNTEKQPPVPGKKATERDI